MFTPCFGSNLKFSFLDGKNEPKQIVSLQIFSMKNSDCLGWSNISEIHLRILLEFAFL